MRGNRRFTATYVNPDDPAAEVVPLRVPPSPRTAAKAALFRLTTAGTDGARRALENVHRNYPSAPEPHCYHGELYLYLGDYVAARDQFERALALYDQTRWAFIGLGAVELLEGHPERTLPLLERSIELSRGAGPTLYVYRGEALFRLGQLEAAIADLEYATQLNPTRLSAWVDLALARDRAGESGALALGLAHVRRVAPGLVHDAAVAAEVDVSAADDPGPSPERETLQVLFETILRLMRGNRSSTCVTYFTDAGLLRVVPHVPAIDTQLEERELHLLRALLERSVGLARKAG
jgi:tetratricopeptide (TPR) repeat protein